MPNERDVPSGAAARMLGLPETSTPAEARSDFLRRLENADFTPSEESCAGAAILGGLACSSGLQFGDRTVQRMRLDFLRQEVDAFAEQYWSMTSRERAAKLRQLNEACEEMPALVRRLRLLAVGIDVEVQEFDEKPGPGALFAGMVKELFPLRPSEQSARINDFLNSESFDSFLWSRRGDCDGLLSPRLKGLLPELFTRIEEFREEILTPEEAEMLREAASERTSIQEGEEAGESELTAAETASNRKIAESSVFLVPVLFIAFIVFANTFFAQRRGPKPDAEDMRIEYPIRKAPEYSLPDPMRPFPTTADDLIQKFAVPEKTSEARP